MESLSSKIANHYELARKNLEKWLDKNLKEGGEIKLNDDTNIVSETGEGIMRFDFKSISRKSGKVFVGGYAWNVESGDEKNVEMDLFALSADMIFAVAYGLE